MFDTLVADIRAFNRFYTRQLGLLDEHIADSPFGLSEARVLYEIHARGHTTATELAQALSLDRAYLSRLLQRFLAAEIVLMSPMVNDRRQNQLALTADGDVVVAELDRNSNAAIEKLLAPLSSGQRRRLGSAMRAIRHLLDDEMPVGPTVLRPHRIGELGWLTFRQGVLYNRQFGWNGEFVTLIAGLYRDFELAPATPPKALWVAERDGMIIGSVFVTPSDGREGAAQLRMLYVEPEARGLGVGRMLVDQAVSFARDSGYARMRLWTQTVLESARKIYAGAGFICVDSTEHHSFGKDLVGEHWELVL